MATTIHTPQLAKVDEHSNTSATFVIEPLHSGYGMTLGNSLRRVLLSSVNGAAVTAFKVEGVSHEFSTIKGVREDVVDIMLNLKGIRFRLYGDEPKELVLTKKGAGAVTAGDLAKDADIEVVNPGHVICNVEDAKTNVTIYLLIEPGRGYRSIEENSNSQADMIALDAIFSPVLRVRYKVEKTRVGQISNLDKLVLSVDTDGTISPKDAFEEAAAILVNQYTALAGQTKIQAAPLSPVKPEGEDVDDPAELKTAIEDLNFSARTTNALINNDIHNLKDLVLLSDAELRDLKGFGSKALDEVKDKLAELEL